MATIGGMARKEKPPPGGAQMQGQGGGDTGKVFPRKESGTARTGQVALSHAECHRLLTMWANDEMQSIRRVWYPAYSAGYQDYEPPRDPETRLEREVRRAERDDAEINRVGWTIFTMRTSQSRTTRTHAQTLLAVYKGIGRPRKDMARRLALDTFGRVFLAWAEQIDGPINSL